MIVYKSNKIGLRRCDGTVEWLPVIPFAPGLFDRIQRIVALAIVAAMIVVAVPSIARALGFV